MTLRIVELPSLAEELDRILPARDVQPLPMYLPAREIIERQLNPPAVVPYRRRRRK